MSIARVGPASAKYQNRIWVAGGMTKSKKEPLSREVECYDPLQNLYEDTIVWLTIKQPLHILSYISRWLKAVQLRSPRCFASMYIVSDSLYVIGGAGNTSKTEHVTESMDSIDVWDQEICAWRQEAKMAIARHGHSTSSIGRV